MKIRNFFTSDEGSILVFGIGLSLVGLMIATVSINVASIWVTRNVLDGIADGAALSAAQAVDVDSVYRQGLGTQLRLSETLARTKVREYVTAANVGSQVQQFSVRSVVVSGTSVTVTVQASPKTAFGYLMPISTPVVVSAAKAINKVR
jgi:archaellum component FlaF (FlaF/FlaG flagellin family)